MSWKEQSMAKEEEEKEGEIPVLTVLKNSTILKNIFIVNKPSEGASRDHHVDVVLVGRHPDCDLMLTHPSISRFHLQIRSKPSSRTFSIVDLSSVHGTWVSGRRIEPMVSVEMKEGDSLRIGVSSRVYRLHWIPISRAYDLENPFLSQLDTVTEVKEQEEEEEEEEKMQNLNCSPAEMEDIESVDSIIEDISSLFLDDNVELAVKEEIPLGPWMLEDMVSLCCEEERKSPSKEDISSLFLDGNVEVAVKEEIPLGPWMLEDMVSLCCEEERKSSSKEEAIGFPCDPHGTKTSFFPMMYDDENNNVELAVQEEIPLAPWMLEDMVSLCCEEERKSPSKEEAIGFPCDPLGTKTSYFPMMYDDENNLCNSVNQVLSPSYMESLSECDGTLTENLSETLCLPTVKLVLETKMLQLYTTPDSFTSPLPLVHDNSFEKQYSSLPVNTAPSTVDEKNADEAVLMPKETEFESERTVRDDEDDIYAFTVPASLHEKGATEDLLMLKESDYECTLRNYGSNTEAFTAGAGNYYSEDTFLPVEEAMPAAKVERIKIVEKVDMDSLYDEEKEVMHMSKSPLQNDKFCHDKEHSLNEIVQDVSNKRTDSIFPTSCQIELINLSIPQEVVLNKMNEDQTLQSVLDGEVEEEEKEIFTQDKENFSPSTLQLRFLKAKVEEFTHSKSQRSRCLSENTFNCDIYPNESVGTKLGKVNQKDIIHKTISKDLFSVLDGEKEEEEIYTPDKENFSPNTLQLRHLKKKGKVEEIKRSKSRRSPLSRSTFSLDLYPNENISPTLCKMNQKDIRNKTISKDLFSDLKGDEEEEEIFTPDKENFSPTTRLRLLKKKDESMSPTSNRENQTLKGAQDQKLQRMPFSSQNKFAEEPDLKNKVERLPFQSLKISGGKRRSETVCPVSAAKGLQFSNCGQILDQRINLCDISGVPKKSSWDMIVDTTSLVNKESRKALQLLQGLKRTRLIIPRLVIRELGRMKKQVTIFRRISEASLALEWIEECMVKTNWWINIQSSVAEERMIPPTPPASPHWSSLSSKCSMEIASPTVVDHILDFALLYKRNQIDGQLVLLSEDITLNIKCMSEGLLCQPVQEFRESLVNPFSERFLWTNSTPLGQTWSCQDDLVLRDKYCPPPFWKSSKRVASGLKLILLHNSQYGLSAIGKQFS